MLRLEASVSVIDVGQLLTTPFGSATGTGPDAKTARPGGDVTFAQVPGTRCVSSREPRKCADCPRRRGSLYSRRSLRTYANASGSKEYSMFRAGASLGGRS